ncbi:MAG TPA: hypothetical protein VKV16_01330, partial [Solirubrobacteraceae bacterium]|nr:hypothetical protein [Solirubrobacteraceae bacterium]
SLDTGGAGATNGTGSTGAAGKTGGTGNTGGAGGGFVSGWAAARRRAEDAPQLLQPGLLAAHVPGGAGYAGIEGDGAGDAGSHVDGVLAAGREGRLAAVSLGRSSTLLARVAGLRARERLVVADLPAGGAGLADLRSLCAARARGELLVAIERTSDARAGALLWSAVAGLRGGGGRELSSQSTRERGVIASFDLAPTILARLGVRIPADVRGKPIETDGVLHGASLRALMARLRVIGPRRLKALAFLLLAWAALLLGGALYRGGRSARGARRARARAWALRTGALGVLWSPAVALLPAWLEPSAAVEYALLALVCLALGALTDVLLAWPRAPLAPALVTLAAFVFDALAGTQLLMRSLLGPDPILGARFYGIGNELKSGLAVLVAAALAGALYPAVRSRRAALAMALAGVLLALVEGSARIGAGVGGVVLVAFGFAVATALLAPGALTRRRALAVLVSPVAALVALAALDLATARGAGHFTGSVLHARSAGDVRDIVVRRYRAAFAELHNHAMPLASALALASGVWALVRRERLLAPVGGDPAWGAALAGGLAAGVVGSLVEDSGPELLVVAVFALGCVVCYLWGRPRVSRAHEAGRLELRADATDGSRA